MKALPFKIPKHETSNIILQEDHDVIFYDRLHQHEEIQISLILEGEGTLIVGDTVNYYTRGDIVIIGSNIPHVFKSDRGTHQDSHMMSLFFTRGAFGNRFFEMEELKEVAAFFKRSEYGFKVNSHRKTIARFIIGIDKRSKLDILINLLQILKLCARASYTSLSSYVYDKKFSVNEGERIRNVFEYTMNHFEKDISLDTIASVANMTKNAFCKYFKKRTNKTYIEFLTELRIEKACQLLTKTKDLQISEIAETCGFNNISNFNRQFKKVKQHAPSHYKSQFLQ